MDWVVTDMFGDCLALGGAGFVVGVLAPIGFRLIGYFLDVVRKFR